MYLELPEAIARIGAYAVHALAEPVGGRTHTLWGPDVTGRNCRMGAYTCATDALRSARILAGQVRPC